MVQIPSCLHSTFKELSNEYSHAQIRVKTKKLWPRQVREEKPVAIQKIVSRSDLMSRPDLRSRPVCCFATKKRCINLKKAEN